MSAIEKVRQLLSSSWLFLTWALLSTALLLLAYLIDPYIFAFTTFAAAAISGLLLLSTVIFCSRMLHCAVLGIAPTVLGFVVLSTFHWA